MAGGYESGGLQVRVTIRVPLGTVKLSGSSIKVSLKSEVGFLVVRGVVIRIFDKKAGRDLLS